MGGQRISKHTVHSGRGREACNEPEPVQWNHMELIDMEFLEELTSSRAAVDSDGCCNYGNYWFLWNHAPCPWKVLGGSGSKHLYKYLLSL